jgi:hypothetical protein
MFSKRKPEAANPYKNNSTGEGQELISLFGMAVRPVTNELGRMSQLLSTNEEAISAFARHN